MSQQTSRFLDVARGIAAFAVLFTHAQSSVLVTVANIPAEHRGSLSWAAWFLYGFAHQAVVVFFVLSGFLVGGNVVSRATSGEPFLKRYLIDRTVRIYTVLVPALVLTAFLDHWGRALFGATGIYDQPAYSGRSGPGTFLANLFNVQDIYAPYFGSNTALWTLAHEYWYYVAFGLIMVWFSRAYSAAARWIALAAAVAITACLSVTLSYHLFGFALWLVGVAAAKLSRPLMRSWQAAICFVMIAIGLRLGLRYSLLENPMIGGIADAAVALGFANLLLALRFDTGPVWRFSQWRIHTYAAEFSYSLYAVHMPILIFLCAASQQMFGIGWHSVPTGPGYWVLLAVILVLVLTSARAFWSLTEAHAASARALAHRVLSERTTRAIRPT